MPKFDYSEMYEVAKELLEDFGGNGVLRNVTFVTPDATKPHTRTPTNVDTVATMCVVPMSAADNKRYFGEDALMATHKGIVLFDSSAEVKVDSSLIFIGKTWMVNALTPIKPYDTGIIFICALSGSV